MDVMITIELKSKKGLNDYLNHPLHLQFISATDDSIQKSYIFRSRNKEIKKEVQQMNGILLNNADTVITVTEDIPAGGPVSFVFSGRQKQIFRYRANSTVSQNGHRRYQSES